MEALNKPVEMISVCRADGELRPLRFRFEDDKHRLHVIRVEEVMVAKEVNYVGVQCFQYMCKAMTNGREFLFELRYMVRLHQWTLYRILS